jgi:hypothetical protein
MGPEGPRQPAPSLAPKFILEIDPGCTCLVDVNRVREPGPIVKLVLSKFFGIGEVVYREQFKNKDATDREWGIPR